MFLTRSERKNGHLAQVEVDQVFSYRGRVSTGVPSAVLCQVGLYLSNVLLSVIFLQHLGSALHQARCISSDISAFLITAFRVHVVTMEQRLPHPAGPFLQATKFQ